MERKVYRADAVFDGARMLPGHALVVADGHVDSIVALADLPRDARAVALGAGTIAPGFVDLQVNGGGGALLNDDPSLASLQTIARAHAGLGTTALLPTLITDTPVRTAAAIDSACAAIRQGVPGIAGLHLEGPHLSVARKGAHDPALIRPMEDADLEMLCAAAARLPSLMVTVAPETVSPEQISALVAAGVTVSLGHSDANYATCASAATAGATCVTHLFNAMSQMGNREPGLVGAALGLGGLNAGLIADGIHVHPVTMANALRAKQGPAEAFLVSDAMATAGSDIDGFALNGRWIERRDGRLTLADGTLAGADLDLARALRVLTGPMAVPLADALIMATSAPARVIRRHPELGRLQPRGQADFVHLDAGLNLTATWIAGQRVPARHQG